MNEEPKYCKRLIEVDLPIKRISAHARREKSIRHGHISTLHIWWARRPLAACRAVLCASLWPDPVDPLCPEEFKSIAREEMLTWANKHITLLSADSFSRFIKIQKNPDLLEDNLLLRKALLDFIADFSNWDNSTVAEYLDSSHRLTQVAHESLGGITGTRPMVVDPFAGGGSIPLEALRVGADAFASDLNPVAVLLNKVAIEYIPHYGQQLADEVKKWGKIIYEEARSVLLEYYPPGPNGVPPIAYLWARTIKCEGPGCGAEVPLMRSLWLAKKGRKSMAVTLQSDNKSKKTEFKINKEIKPLDNLQGTVKRGSSTCHICGYTTNVSSVRNQLKQRRGGTSDAQLVAIRENDNLTEERSFRQPTELEFEAYEKANLALEKIKKQNTLNINLPNESTPGRDGHRAVSSVILYGMNEWGDLFNKRQALTLLTFAQLIASLNERLIKEYNQGLAVAIQTCLALALDRLADFNSSLCVLNVVGGRGVVHTFGRQAIPMVWDYMETNQFNEYGANWMGSVNTFVDTIRAESCNTVLGQTHCCSATENCLSNNIAECFFTDPPYYDAIPYAELSDFFYVWLKRTLKKAHPDLFENDLTPKKEQVIVWHPNSLQEKNEFEKKMRLSMSEGRRILTSRGIGIIVFAHKSTSGWESQLQSMVDGGWVITCSWPIDTERPGRVNSHNTASLASSIHLVCRPRENPDGSLRTDLIGDWRDVLQELPKRIHEWMPRLAENGVVGADAIFACLGPALEVFSRYSSVEKPNGDQVLLQEYMEHVWATISREALSVVFSDADASGFEEDSRLTAIWLWSLSTAQGKDDLDSKVAVALNREALGDDDPDYEDDEKPTSKTKSSGYLLEYDTARKIAQGLGAHLEKLNSIVEIKGDTARLLPVEERARYLFGKIDEPVAVKKKAKAKQEQPSLFDLTDDFENGSFSVEPSIRQVGAPKAGETVLDRVHQSMLLFATGRADAMKRFLIEDGIGHDQRFWKLAQALSALYPSASDEKRWVDGVLARKKGLGL